MFENAIDSFKGFNLNQKFSCAKLPNLKKKTIKSYNEIIIILNHKNFKNHKIEYPVT